MTPAGLDREDPERRYRRHFEQAMRKLDANGDGGLSIEEIEADPRIARLAERFDDADQDQDGLLRAEEIAAAVRSGGR